MKMSRTTEELNRNIIEKWNWIEKTIVCARIILQYSIQPQPDWSSFEKKTVSLQRARGTHRVHTQCLSPYVCLRSSAILARRWRSSLSSSFTFYVEQIFQHYCKRAWNTSRTHNWGEFGGKPLRDAQQRMTLCHNVRLIVYVSACVSRSVQHIKAPIYISPS